MLLVALLVLRVDIKEYITNSDSLIAEYIKNISHTDQAPADIISLANLQHPQETTHRQSTNTATQVETQDPFITENNTEDVETIKDAVEKNVSDEMNRIKIAAAVKYARLKAELQKITSEDKSQDKKSLSTVKNETIATKITESSGSRKPQKLIIDTSLINAPKTRTPINEKITKTQLSDLKAAPNNILRSDRIALLNTKQYSRPVESTERNLDMATKSLATQNSHYTDDTVVIIVNSKNTQDITSSDIKNLYTDRMTTWQNGEKINVYNLPVNSPARETFSYKFLHKSPSQAAAASSNRVVTNVIRNATETKTDRIIVSIISSNSDAIGYTTYKNVKGKNKLRIVMALESK